MSIISSIITPQFAILKSDTKGTWGTKTFKTQKCLILSDDKQQKELLIGFVGALNYNHVSVIDRIHLLKDDILSAYDYTDEIVAFLLNYFKFGVKTASDIKGANETLAFNIVSKKDYEIDNPRIHSIFIDYREGRTQSFKWNMAIDKSRGFAYAKEGENVVQNELARFIDNTKDINSNDHDYMNTLLETSMEAAIKMSGGSCSMPLDTIYFKYS